MYAEDLMDEPFICCYSDICSPPTSSKRLLANPADIALVVDTDWLERYEHRSRPSARRRRKGDRRRTACVTRVHRGIDAERRYGEYIGVAKFSAQARRR